MKLPTRLSIAALAISGLAANAATVSNTDPQAGGIGYRWTVTMNNSDSATFARHVGAWSWEDNALFGNPGQGTQPVGWTHTSDWVALSLSSAAVFTIRIERQENVPWPSASDPTRVASIDSMFPSFTIWRNWDNDGTDSHTYYNRGNVSWAEDITYLDHFDNSTETFIERTYLLPAGDYSIAIGSNAPANNTKRQGYRATFNTQPLAIIATQPDSYFTVNANSPLVVSAAQGVLANDIGVSRPAFVVQVTQPPQRGSVVAQADGSFTYTPGPFFGIAGSDSFKYTAVPVGDPAGALPETSVTIQTLASAAGIYAGHVIKTINNKRIGIANANISNKGVVTGVLQRSQQRVPFKGTLQLNGAVQLSTGSLDLLGVRLLAEPSGKRNMVVDILTPDVLSEQVLTLLKQSPFSALAPAPYAGNHTLALSSNSSASTPPYPSGGGFGLLKIGKNGLVSLTGKLGDNTSYSCASALVVDDLGQGVEAPLYSPAYKNPVGDVSGVLSFAASATADAGGVLNVLKPAQVQAGPYQAGFAMSYQITGKRWPVLSSSASLPLPTSPLLFTFGAAGSHAQLQGTATLNPGGRTFTASSPLVRVTVSAATGIIGGVYVDPVNGKRMVFSGALMDGLPSSPLVDNYRNPEGANSELNP